MLLRYFQYIEVQSAPLRRRILINIQRVRHFCAEEGLQEETTGMIQACVVQYETHCLAAYERRVNH